ncbi:MAG: hypothetical protein H0T84_06975, partial [Tatlockia sp.]|nr:hypothetical protein [Tatlockia sp.]
MTISISVIGLMIGEDYKDFKLYQRDANWEKNNPGKSRSGSSFHEGLEEINNFLPMTVDDTSQFVIVYDVSCPNKEEYIKQLLALINRIKKNDLLPALISIGHEQSPLSEEIIRQVSTTKEVANTENQTEFFRKIIEETLSDIKKEHIATDKIEIESSQIYSRSAMNINMMVLGGFIAAAGIVAVAVAFTVLNATTFGVPGLVVAGIGVAVALSGIGLFATGAYKNWQEPFVD